MTPLRDGNASGVTPRVSNVRLLRPGVRIDPIERQNTRSQTIRRRLDPRAGPSRYCRPCGSLPYPRHPQWPAAGRMNVGEVDTPLLPACGNNLATDKAQEALLLICGIAATLIYVSTDLVARILY